METATPILTSTAGSDCGIIGRLMRTYAAIVPAGQTAGHTASISARRTDRPTRLQLAGKRTKIDVALTGTSVPIATPARPSGFTSAMLIDTLTTAVTTLTTATRRWRSAPLSSVLPVAW